MRPKLAVVLILIIATVSLATPLPDNLKNQSQPYLNGALSAARWIESTSVTTSSGVVWPDDPTDPKSVNTSLYAGTPGPILFFLELYRYTGEAEFLQQAKSGADALAASLAAGQPTGLYEGLAGDGFTLGEAYLVTHDQKYRAAALQCVEWLKQSAKKAGNGIEWNDTTDVIAGGSGTGLFLLWAADKLQAPGARQVAIEAGKHLIELGKPTGDDGTRWLMDPTFPREMPNFSHGTAGVAYFLATLYQVTKQKEFLDAALKGAHYLISIADKQGDICLIYHDDTPNGKSLYYLGWCHGPAGTARLFYRLYQDTHDRQWLDWTERSARALVAEGAPEKVVSPGVWHNISACCGVTAEAEFFMDMYQLTKKSEYLSLAKQASDRLLTLATDDEQGTRWVQVETRVRPDVAIAQTGYMQGASGVGLWLLHMSALSEGKSEPTMAFPDNPFAY
ncbi:MAG: lanthionine synthetase LanC family protein [Candidatus Acidiferrales bacterium]